MPAGRSGPYQGARFRVFELPAFALLAFMVMPAQRREVTFARYPALVPGLRVVEVAPGGRAGAARRGTSGYESSVTDHPPSEIEGTCRQGMQIFYQIN